MVDDKKKRREDSMEEEKRTGKRRSYILSFIFSVPLFTNHHLIFSSPFLPPFPNTLFPFSSHLLSQSHLFPFLPSSFFSTSCSSPFLSFLPLSLIPFLFTNYPFIFSPPLHSHSPPSWFSLLPFFSCYSFFSSSPAPSSLPSFLLSSPLIILSPPLVLSLPW